jgi:hypothetical protein
LPDFCKKKIESAVYEEDSRVHLTTADETKYTPPSNKPRSARIQVKIQDTQEIINTNTSLLQNYPLNYFADQIT